MVIFHSYVKLPEGNPHDMPTNCHKLSQTQWRNLVWKAGTDHLWPWWRARGSREKTLMAPRNGWRPFEGFHKKVASLYWKSAGHILSSFKCNYLVAAGFVALWIGARFETMFRIQRCAMEHPPYASLFVYNMMIYLKKLGLALPRWFAEVCIVCLFSLWRSSLLSLLFEFPTD